MSLLVTAVLGVLALILVTTPAIYFGLSYLADEAAVAYAERVTYHRAVALAILGTLVWATLHVFFSWIPVIGLILPPLAWIGVLKRYTACDWPTAIIVGIIAWVPSALAYRGAGILVF